MDRKTNGLASFGTMTLVVSGLAFFGLLLYGMKSGQDLPLWPAIAVALVNVVAAVKIVMNVKKAKSQQRAPAAPSSRASEKAAR